MLWDVRLPQQVVLLALGTALVGGTLFHAPRVWAGVAIGALFAAAGALAAGLAEGHVPPSDRLAAAIVALAIVVGLLHALAALELRRRSRVAAEHFGLLLTGVFGLMLAATAEDLIVLALACELVAVPGYLLAYLSARSPIPSATPRGADGVLLKLLLPGVVSSLFLWYGFALLAGLAGTTDLSGIAEVLARNYRASAETAMAAGGSLLGVLAAGMIFVGAGLRMAAAPFHLGLPDVFARIGFAEGGWLSTGPRLVAWVVLARICLFAMPGYESVCLSLAGVLAAVTLLGAGALAVAEPRLRPLLGYAGMAQGGLALAGLAAAFAQAQSAPPGASTGAGLPSGLQASLFHLIAFILMTGGLAALLTYFDRAQRPLEHVEDLAGWVRDEPVAGACTVLLLIGLAGLPVLPGFWGRLFLAGSLLAVEPEWLEDWSAGFHPGLLVLAGAMIVGCVLLAAAYLRPAAALLFERPLGRPRPAGGRPALAGGILAVLLSMGIGLFPGPLLAWLEDRPPASADRRSPARVGPRSAPDDSSKRVDRDSPPPADEMRPVQPLFLRAALFEIRRNCKNGG
ncbi:MAG: proton-conducting transporter membrane subunit [Planctomycetales bacterium]